MLIKLAMPTPLYCYFGQFAAFSWLLLIMPLMDLDFGNRSSV